MFIQVEAVVKADQNCPKIINQEISGDKSQLSGEHFYWIDQYSGGQVGSPRKGFKRILNFWGNTSQPEPNPAKPR